MMLFNYFPRVNYKQQNSDVSQIELVESPRALAPGYFRGPRIGN
jgi:hypothetical protein